MNAKQSNRLETLEDTHGFLSTTPAIGALAAMPPKVARLNTLLELIRAAGQVQALPVRFAVRERDQAAEAAIELVFVIAGALRSYAATNSRPELLDLASVSRRRFEQLRRSQRMQLAQQVLDAAQPLAAELADYGVTAAMLEDLEAKITAGNAVVLSPRRASARRRAATLTLQRNFSAVFKLLREEIDPLIETLRLSDPTAYAAYQQARSVFNRPGVRSLADDESQSAAVASSPAEATAPAAQPSSLAA